MQNKKQQQQGETVIDKQQQTDHSLSADLAMGWRPKLKVIGPIPLNFDNDFIDRSIKELLKSQAAIYTVVYLGPRPLNTFKMHQVLKKKYKYKYQHLFAVEYGYLKAFFHQFYGQFEPKMKMPFLGMNPLSKTHKITFDSCFESGNLDSAVKVNDSQYDLMLRIDSNTAGHIMWYYFRVTNNENTAQRIKLNIVNLRRNKSCYQRGMKPYIRRKRQNSNVLETEQSWTQWEQGGINVQVQEEKIRFAKQTFIFSNGNVGIQQPPMIFRRLTFQVEFQPFEEIQFAYCVPYAYSDMMNDLKLIKQSITDQGLKNIHFEVDNNNESLSGLQIPVLKITQKQNDKYDEETQKNKFCVFIIGRQHAGESNGSFVMRGILNQLIKDTPQVKFLRKHIVFKIIPMLNVDGVVLGNFRTSLYGKDLNRLFRKKQLFLIPQIEMCKDEFNNLLKIHKNKVMLFLDIHGHSARRNAFCYGPGILDSNVFNDVRQFAKIIASRTEIFRYPSCSFRIDHDKKTTARACFSKSVGLAYTIESSNWSFYSRSQAKMIDFTRNQWEQIGLHIIESLSEYADQKIRKRSKNKNNKNKNQRIQVKTNERKVANQGQGIKSVSQHQIKQTPRKLEKKIETSKDLSNKKQSESRKPSQIRKSRKSKYAEQYSENEYEEDQQTLKRSKKYKMTEIQQQENESDKMSEKQMDSDCEGEDMEKNKFQKYMSGAKRMMIEFQKVYFGEEYEKKSRTAAKLRLQAKKLMKDNSNKNIKKNCEILACLRKKQPISTQQFQPLEIGMIRMGDIAGKIRLQQKKLVQNSIPMSTKQIQFHYEQNEGDVRKIMLISHKAQFQKLILPRIQESYQTKIKREFIEKDFQKNNISRIQEWSQSHETPQLLSHEQQNDLHNQQYDDFYISRSKIKRKSISKYERKTQNQMHELIPQISERNDEKLCTVQSHAVQEEEYEQLQPAYSSSSSSEQNDIGNLGQEKIDGWDHSSSERKGSLRKYSDDFFSQESNIRRVRQNLRYSLMQKKARKQAQEMEGKNEAIHDVPSNTNRNQHSVNGQKDTNDLRFSLKVPSTQLPSRFQSVMRSKKQLEYLKKMQIIQKLSDPISLAYGVYKNQLASSQDIGGMMNKNNTVNFEFHHFNYSKQQNIGREDQSNRNHEKIQQIIMNNMQQMNGNFESNTRAKRYNSKRIQHKQKLSIDAMPVNTNNQQDEHVESLQNAYRLSQHKESTQKSNLIEISKAEHLIAASLIFPKNNTNQSEKIKTLQSQNCLKKQMITTKQIKNPLSASRNYSQRLTENCIQKLPESEYYILKEEQRINRKVMKFGAESLPKISNNDRSKAPKIKSPHQLSKTKVILKKPGESETKISPQKGQKLSPVRPKPTLIADLPQKDFTNIKLICMTENNLKPQSQQQKKFHQQPTKSIINLKKQTNKEVLMNRLKQLENQGRQKFGEQHLITNKEMNELQNKSQNIFMIQAKEQSSEIKKQIAIQQNKKLKTNASEDMNKEDRSSSNKQMKIFALPTNKFSVSINKSQHKK